MSAAAKNEPLPAMLVFECHAYVKGEVVVLHARACTCVLCVVCKADVQGAASQPAIASVLSLSSIVSGRRAESLLLLCLVNQFESSTTTMPQCTNLHRAGAEFQGRVELKLVHKHFLVKGELRRRRRRKPPSCCL